MKRHLLICEHQYRLQLSSVRLETHIRYETPSVAGLIGLLRRAFLLLANVDHLENL